MSRVSPHLVVTLSLIALAAGCSASVVPIPPPPPDLNIKTPNQRRMERAQPHETGVDCSRSEIQCDDSSCKASLRNDCGESIRCTITVPTLCETEEDAETIRLQTDVSIRPTRHRTVRLPFRCAPGTETVIQSTNVLCSRGAT